MTKYFSKKMKFLRKHIVTVCAESKALEVVQ